MTSMSFNGVTAASKGVIVIDYPPYVKPQSRVKVLTIPGRNGSLIINEEAYENIELDCRCVALPTANIESISDWLTGSGDPILGNASDRSLKARVDGRISFDKIISGHQHRGFTIPFVCQPGRYTYPPLADVVMTEPGVISNPGTMQAEPKITVVATGEITLTVGTSIMLINGPETEWTLVIDSELMDCFDGTMTLLRNDWMTGDFPLLNPGANAVTWSGTVASVTITPRWRYL